ncbi:MULTISPECIES: MGH1-like glycoside hydrolase domain-containing protein [unclassified Paenibacillus]|uniref:MGH1-like glycoside hydrolase domain-containing protein n=1 Tax=unclassified Paenibacillus TaxID=185978 RepID=UPI00070B2C62|nr:MULTISPECIES: hypothetical protein [unclassified Paenibacillus]KQX46737.1 hypothetical protein ASD40_15710 [Paenibacillus sp. Root444D2]KRE34183.1 hypothetical protein ASG85_12480 [Paenibacillus sp. Soil724D2]
MKEALLSKLRGIHTEERMGPLKKESDGPVLAEWNQSGVKFAASSDKLEGVYYEALRKLLDCVVPTGGEKPILHEGGIYLGCWLESTGTINAELLSRFIPSVSQSTYELFADYQREDGLMPYKLTDSGPSYRQIQLVTPLARSVWNHYQLNGQDKTFLRKMYTAMQSYDDWLYTYRNTRGTNGVEAFCTFDTGHDLSPRFWHVPDTPHGNDARICNPDSPILPFVAPDLTANVYCQRLYLARIAEELEESGELWREKAEMSLNSLFQFCFDEKDQFFYDLDKNDVHVRVQSDVLLRVLACEVGDRAFFDQALRKYLLNTRKFFAKYPFTSMAMDDPRFDPFSSYNSWAGPSNFLSLIRAPHAFEHHGRFVELTYVLYPLMAAFHKMTRFAQALSPWTGEEGFTETYSPAILCMLDYVERLSGIMPRPDDELWFTGLLPYAVDHGEEIANGTAYSRVIDGITFELVNTKDESVVYRNGVVTLQFPNGLRAVTDREGKLKSFIGMTVRTVEGVISYEGREWQVAVKGNEWIDMVEGHEMKKRAADLGVIAPTYG